MNNVPNDAVPDLPNSEVYANKHVGLFGGSFNPPHQGHLHIAKTALDKLDLDLLWWCVTPRSPFKQRTPMMSFEDRLQQSMLLCKEIENIHVTDIERQLDTHTTYETLNALYQYYPQTRFTFIAGLDCALQFMDWDHAQNLLDGPADFAFLARPPLAQYDNVPHTLKQAENVHFILDMPLSAESSTEIRNHGQNESKAIK